MFVYLLLAFLSIVASLPTNEVSSVIAGPQISKSRFSTLTHGHLRGKPNLPQLESAPKITDEILSSDGESFLENNPINEGLTGWSGAKKADLERLLAKQNIQNDFARDEKNTARALRKSERDSSVISTQPGPVDLPLDHPLASRLGSPYHYTNGDVSYESYESCYNEDGYRPTTDELKEFRDMLYTEGRRNKAWINGREKTVAQYGADGKKIEWVEHGEKYNKCCCCCKTWTVQARKPQWQYDATCEYSIRHEICSGVGSSRVCTSYYTTDTDRVKVTPYVETSPCCCEIIGCCGRVGARIRGNV